MPTPQDYQRFGIDPRTKVGGQKLNAPVADPTAAMKYLDPVEMVLGMPWSNTEPLPDPNQILAGVAGAMTPAYLRPEYEAPDTRSKITDALVGLGQVFQGGSGTEGVLGGGGTLLAQALGDLPAASDAMGTLMGVRTTDKAKLQKLPELYTPNVGSDELFRRTDGWFLDKDLQPKYEISDANANWRGKSMEQVLEAFWNDPSLQNKAGYLAGKFDSLFQNDALREALPKEYADLTLRVHNRPEQAMYNYGYYEPSKNEIGLFIPPKPDAKGALLGQDSTPSPMNEQTKQHWLGSALDRMRKTALHESGHFVSNVHSPEGWAFGTNPTSIEWDINNEIRRALGERQAAYEDSTSRLRHLLVSPEGYALRGEKLTSPEYKAYWSARQATAHSKPDAKDIAQLVSAADQLHPELRALIMPELKDMLITGGEDIVREVPWGRDESFPTYQANLDETNSRTIEASADMDIAQILADPFYSRRDRWILPHEQIQPRWTASTPREEARRARPLK